MPEPSEPALTPPEKKPPRFARETPPPDPAKIRIGDNVIIEGEGVGKVVGRAEGGTDLIVAQPNVPKRSISPDSLSPLPKKPQP